MCLGSCGMVYVAGAYDRCFWHVSLSRNGKQDGGE